MSRHPSDDVMAASQHHAPSGRLRAKTGEAKRGVDDIFPVGGDPPDFSILGFWGQQLCCFLWIDPEIGSEAGFYSETSVGLPPVNVVSRSLNLLNRLVLRGY
jgi:hypothetical protein